MMYSDIIEKMKSCGVEFSTGLSESDLRRIENVYGIRFPRVLREFYANGVPRAVWVYDFPQWQDFSEKNVSSIIERINAPYEWVLADLKRDRWLSRSGVRPDTDEEIESVFAEKIKSAPVMIPVCGHRYVPLIDGIDDPPVISIVGCDSIFYGSSLEDYLRREFNMETDDMDECAHVPFWSDIIENQ